MYYYLLIIFAIYILYGKWLIIIKQKNKQKKYKQKKVNIKIEDENVTYFCESSLIFDIFSYHQTIESNH